MSLPAGWLATRIGYKRGIIFGLLLVAVGGFWFIPATKIVGFLGHFFFSGVCLIASGLTFLETVANPYTTVLGPSNSRRPASISRSPATASAGSWDRSRAASFFIPRTPPATTRAAKRSGFLTPASGIVVIVLAIIFYFASVPDIKAEDDYRLDESTPRVSHSIWAHPHYAGGRCPVFLRGGAGRHLSSSSTT